MDDPTDVAFTPAVRAAQARKGAAAALALLRLRREIDPELRAFIESRDSAYLATASADGQPYVQHRGGPPGFLRVTGPATVAFADLRGNRHYVTTGNLSENPRAFLFLMDYGLRKRVKLWGRARVVEDDPALAADLSPPGQRAPVEQAILFEVEAWDVNCARHIPRKLDAMAVAEALDEKDARIAALEAELAALRARG